MAESKTHHTIISDLGFAPISDVRGRLSIADRFTKSKSRTGIYVLAFANQSFYIGQATEVCRRFAQHRSSVGDIVGFTFMPLRAAALDTTERHLIRAAEAAGLPITNRVHVSTILGETDFDLLVAPAKQEDWIRSWPRLTEDGSERVDLPSTSLERLRTAQKLERLTQHAAWNEVRQCLQRYCVGCIPFPGKTQLTFWSASCLPSTNKSSWPRFSAINAGIMELLVIGWEAGHRETWGFVNVSRSVIEHSYGSVASFQRRHRDVGADSDRQYRAAGADQLSLSASSITALTALLSEPPVRDAAAQLALRVMRTRSTIYAKFHCPGLADAILV